MTPLVAREGDEWWSRRTDGLLPPGTARREGRPVTRRSYLPATLLFIALAALVILVARAGIA